MNRRKVLRSTGVAVVTGGSIVTGSAAMSDSTSATTSSSSSRKRRFRPKIQELQYPLAAVPQIREPGETIRIEVDAASIETAWLKASFGHVTPSIPLSFQDSSTERSEIWRFESYTTALATVPGLDDGIGWNGVDDFTEGLYDLHVRTENGVDVQPRAVSVHHSFPQEPTVAIIGDPHVGDARGVGTGFEEAIAEGSPEPFLFRKFEILGPTTEDRWGPFKKVVAELNAADPDLVLCVGDLVYGNGTYHQEYEAAYDILNLVDAPTFTTIGNHDAYVQPGFGFDGKVIYEQTFAPRYYSVEVRPGLHLLTLDTYDWPSADRLAPKSVPSSWGGQVRTQQLEWARRSLESVDPEQTTVVALGHHNPSWKPNPDSPLRTLSNRLNRKLDAISELLAYERHTKVPDFGGRRWAGAGRLELRDLFAESGVSLFVGGHAHADRVARYHEGHVVETPGHNDFSRDRLHYVDRDGSNRTDEFEQAELASVLRRGDGPLLVDTTTASASTTEYWGWRRFDLDLTAERIDPERLGYPASEAFLTSHPVEPEQWLSTFSEFGTYSRPSYRFDITQRSGSDTHVELEADNRLAVPVSGTVLISLQTSRDPAIDGGELVWRRVSEDSQDVRVAYDVDSTDRTVIRVEASV